LQSLRARRNRQVLLTLRSHQCVRALLDCRIGFGRFGRLASPGAASRESAGGHRPTIVASRAICSLRAEQPHVLYGVRINLKVNCRRPPPTCSGAMSHTGHHV
jgi:hypothetical protein